MVAGIMRSRALVACVGAVSLALGACSDPPAATQDGLVPVRLGGRVFRMELADDNDERARGLGWRKEIAPDGGMLFVFTAAADRNFVMRDCLVDIDIAYLDDSRRIVSMYTMKVEPPRAENEAEGNYEARLKQYPSRFPARYVLEFAAGTLARLGVRPGDEAEFRVPASSR